MRFQGEECVLNMASSFNRNDVLLHGTFWIRRLVGESVRYRQPWLCFTHTLSVAENNSIREWLQAVAANKPVEPMFFFGQVKQLQVVASTNPSEISLLLHYDHSPEPIWWAWDITMPLQIRIDIPRNEFSYLITVFDKVEWSFY